MQLDLADYLSRHRAQLLELVAQTHQLAAAGWNRTLVRWCDLAATDPASALARTALEEVLLMLDRLRLAHSRITLAGTPDGLCIASRGGDLSSVAEVALSDLLDLIAGSDPGLAMDLGKLVRTATEEDLTTIADIVRRRLEDAPLPPAA